MQNYPTVDDILKTIRDLERKFTVIPFGVVMHGSDIEAVLGMVKRESLYPLTPIEESPHLATRLYGMPLHNWDEMDATERLLALRLIRSGELRAYGSLKRELDIAEWEALQQRLRETAMSVEALEALTTDSAAPLAPAASEQESPSR